MTTGHPPLAMYLIERLDIGKHAKRVMNKSFLARVVWGVVGAFDLNDHPFKHGNNALRAPEFNPVSGTLHAPPFSFPIPDEKFDLFHGLKLCLSM